MLGASTTNVSMTPLPTRSRGVGEWFPSGLGGLNVGVRTWCCQGLGCWESRNEERDAGGSMMEVVEARSKKRGEEMPCEARTWADKVVEGMLPRLLGNENQNSNIQEDPNPVFEFKIGSPETMSGLEGAVVAAERTSCQELLVASSRGNFSPGLSCDWLPEPPTCASEQWARFREPSTNVPSSGTSVALSSESESTCFDSPRGTSSTPRADMLYPWEVEMMRHAAAASTKPAAEEFVDVDDHKAQSSWPADDCNHSNAGHVPLGKFAGLSPRPAMMFEVDLQRTDFRPIGLDTRPLVSDRAGALRVESVKAEGLAAEWNERIRGKGNRIRPGDLVVGVNGVNGMAASSEELLDQITRPGPLHLLVMRERHGHSHSSSVASGRPRRSSRARRRSAPAATTTTTGTAATGATARGAATTPASARETVATVEGRGIVAE